MKNVRMHSRASIKAAPYNIYTRRQKRARDAEGRMDAVYSALHIVSLLWAFGFIDRSIDRSSATALHSFIGIILWYDHYPCSDKMLPSIQPRLSRAPPSIGGGLQAFVGAVAAFLAIARPIPFMFLHSYTHNLMTFLINFLVVVILVDGVSLDQLRHAVEYLLLLLLLLIYSHCT